MASIVVRVWYEPLILQPNEGFAVYLESAPSRQKLIRFLVLLDWKPKHDMRVGGTKPGKICLKALPQLQLSFWIVCVAARRLPGVLTVNAVGKINMQEVSFHGVIRWRLNSEIREANLCTGI